ncbi:nitroreductase [Paraburkholderia gardini]|uniref:Nitroreductase NfnB n=1 Tax=Paraburkholderia gardini TaxID=2823469 RepID=A0ABM8U9E5_9BURK|nr:nitroreductase [Paraburkholderia gardini]CAG4919008.1 Nitroreductase NfnB [Paraburkholderia gardini]
MYSSGPEKLSATTRHDNDFEVVRRLLDERYSCRAFRPGPVPRDAIEKILVTAQRTASWCNSQSWHVTITEGEGTERLMRTLYEHASNEAPQEPDFAFPREYKGVYLDRRRETGFQLYSALGIGRGDKAAYSQQALENFRCFGAPHVAIITTDEALGIYGAIDCGCYVSNFLLAAHASGVATVPQAALSSYAKVVRRELNLGADRRMVCAISFGYADEGHPANSYRTNRAPLEEAVQWISA